VTGLDPATQTRSLAQASDLAGRETMHALPSHNVMLICRFKRKWRRTHLISRKTENDENSSLAFFLLFWTFSLGFFLCFCFFCFIPLPLDLKVKGYSNDGGWLLLGFSCFCSFAPGFFFFFLFSPSFLHSASPFFFLPLCFSSLSSSPLCLVFLPVFPPLLLSVRLSSGFYS